MSIELRAAFDTWWEDFKSEHEEYQYADSDALRFAAWRASRNVALNEAHETVHCIALVREGTALECEAAIMRLLK